MSVVPVIAVFTKFDMLVEECWNGVDESLRYSEEGEHMAQQQAQEIGVTITLDQWAALTPEQRFALIKLSRSDHENENFLPAIKEFHLV